MPESSKSQEALRLSESFESVQQLDTNKQTTKQAETLKNKETEQHTQRHTQTETNRLTDRQRDRQIYAKTKRHNYHK